ncbi:hypothetical protein ACSLOD_28015, partial [Escherichia coli]
KTDLGSVARIRVYGKYFSYRMLNIHKRKKCLSDALKQPFQKDSGNLTPTQQKEQLRELRKRWEVKHNEHMRKHGFERGFIDC